MQGLRKAVVFGLALSLAPAAVAACVLPFVELSLAERQCCQMMGPECGQSHMPDSHSCCATKAPTDTASLAATKSFSVAPPAQLGSAGIADAAEPPADLGPLHGIFLTIHSPPEAPPGSLAILRI